MSLLDTKIDIDRPGLDDELSPKEEFLNLMDEIIPWKRWVKLIAPFYPSGKRGRPPIGIEKMLRMYVIQVCYSLSDRKTQFDIKDSYAFRRFLRCESFDEKIPDATTLQNFRALLTKHGLEKRLFEDVVARLDEAGLMMRGGSAVDAAIIKASSSTKNRDKQRDPEMHSTRKGQNAYFGSKIHTAVDVGTGYVHSVEGTAANVHDITEAPKLIRKDDEVVYADSGYLGLDKRPEVVNDPHLSKVDYQIVNRPSRRKTPKTYEGINWERNDEHRKASRRCIVEHPYRIIKNEFGFVKNVYRGLKKNIARYHMLFAMANLLMCARAGRTSEFAEA